MVESNVRVALITYGIKVLDFVNEDHTLLV